MERTGLGGDGPGLHTVGKRRHRAFWVEEAEADFPSGGQAPQSFEQMQGMQPMWFGGQVPTIDGKVHGYQAPSVEYLKV